MVHLFSKIKNLFYSFLESDDWIYESAVQDQIDFINERIQEMQEILNSLREEVERSRTLTASAITLIEGLASEIEARIDDPGALQDLVDELDMGSDALASAIAANTPVEAMVDDISIIDSEDPDAVLVEENEDTPA